ncbi:hypothetical protein LINPERHAP1_LOCUS11730 [Linum perenne]
MLFILLTPGLLIQVPGNGRYVEFSNFQTSGVSVLVHAILYFSLMCIFLLAIGLHMWVLNSSHMWVINTNFHS